MELLNIYEKIYKDVFCKTFSRFFFVFLCGGADKNNIRNRVRTYLEKERFQVLYPEDLFMDMLNRDKNSDLLEYENLLADSADVVCIICESMGSAVELGAFVQSEKFEQKLIVCMNQKYARDKSFIMMGPVKHLEKKNKQKWKGKAAACCRQVYKNCETCQGGNQNGNSKPQLSEITGKLSVFHNCKKSKSI